MDGYRTAQCSRKRGHGPGKSYCKQHSPEARTARQAKHTYEHELKIYERWLSLHKTTLPIINAIASGHNDPRGLCKSWLEEHMRERPKPPASAAPPPPPTKKV